MTRIAHAVLRKWARNDVITSRRLQALGYSRDAIAASLRREHLFPAYRGVFFLSANPSSLPRWTAATARCAPHGILSHNSAAALWQLAKYAGRPHVTVPRGTINPIDGIVLHRTTRELSPARLHGIPVTTLHRTLDDYATTAIPHDLRRALRQAEYHHGIDLTVLNARAISAKLRAVLAAYVPREGLTDSELEAAFLVIAMRAGLPSPEVQRHEAGGRADFVWPHLKLIVEVDGYAAHGGRIAFREDRARDRRNLLGGKLTLRYTWEDVTLDADALVAELASIASSLSTAASTKS